MWVFHFYLILPCSNCCNCPHLHCLQADRYHVEVYWAANPCLQEAAGNGSAKGSKFHTLPFSERHATFDFSSKLKDWLPSRAVETQEKDEWKWWDMVGQDYDHSCSGSNQRHWPLTNLSLVGRGYSGNAEHIFKGTGPLPISAVCHAIARLPAEATYPLSTGAARILSDSAVPTVLASEVCLSPLCHPSPWHVSGSPAQSSWPNPNHRERKVATT